MSYAILVDPMTAERWFSENYEREIFSKRDRGKVAAALGRAADF
jgi:hypothetical protein